MIKRQMALSSEISSSIQMVAIGSSAGGTEVLRKIISSLPADFPCVVVVQHILAGFSQMFAETLDKKSEMDVSVAKGGEHLALGKVYIAGDGAQLRVHPISGGAYLVYGEADKISGHCPSVDALFSSAAKLRSSVIGVILTGMGSDGAKGLLEMRQAGAYTIGQDEQSSMVYGMPKAAFEKGAVIKQLPDEAIAKELIFRVRKAK